jgi:hypothetical protein
MGVQDGASSLLTGDLYLNLMATFDHLIHMKTDFFDLNLKNLVLRARSESDGFAEEGFF